MFFPRSTVLVPLLYAISAAQDTPSFHAEVNLVNVTGVVRSQAGELITNLEKGDFEVLEDGVEQPIRFFARQADLPLSLGLIIDVSGSQEKFIKQHNKDVQAFLEAVLRPADQAFVVCFGNHLRLVADSTNSTPSIIDNLRAFSKRGGDFAEIGPQESRDLGTALYDAVYYSVTEKLEKTEHRRALLLFSDGEENSSEHDLLDAISAAQSADTLVYCIRYTHKEHGKLNARNRYGIRVMRHLASQTGAMDYDAEAQDLQTVFANIGEELHSLYEIGYLSTNRQQDGSFRKITIRCKRANTVVRAKSGYYPR